MAESNKVVKNNFNIDRDDVSHEKQKEINLLNLMNF